MESEVHTTVLLRKALVVARKLSVPEFQEWISFELNGYGKGNDIPEYRQIRGEIKAWNPYHGYVPVIIQDPKMAGDLSQRAIGQAIGELESFTQNPKNSTSPLQVKFSPSTEKNLMHAMRVPLQPTLHVSPSEVYGILDAVRNTILEWALSLEEEGILGEGMSFTNEEKQKAMGATVIHIQNFQGVLGDVEGSTVTQNLSIVIKENDFSTLASYLESVGLSAEDIKELEDAISEDSHPTASEDYGEKTSGWIGKMVAKAATGAWQVGVGSAGGLLAQALSSFFGFAS